MDINNMNAQDYLNLYYFTKYPNSSIFEDYTKNFKPTLQDIKNYNKKVEQFEKTWKKDKSLVHKFISLREQKDDVKEDNDFGFCADIGHKFELWVEKECKKYGVDLKMYYDDKQFEGENALGLEIKHDSKLAETGNVYIEYLALNKDETDFIIGGILKEDNSKYWLIGTEKEYYIFYKSDLLRIYNRLANEKEKSKYCKFAERRTSKGIVIAREYCKKIMIADNIGEFLVKVGIIK